MNFASYTGVERQIIKELQKGALWGSIAKIPSNSTGKEIFRRLWLKRRRARSQAKLKHKSVDAENTEEVTLPQVLEVANSNNQTDSVAYWDQVMELNYKVPITRINNEKCGVFSWGTPNRWTNDLVPFWCYIAVFLLSAFHFIHCNHCVASVIKLTIMWITGGLWMTVKASVFDAVVCQTWFPTGMSSDKILHL